MDVTPHELTDLDKLRRRIRKEANAKQRDRWRAVLLALEGKTTAEIMDKLGRSKNFVQRWVYFYRDCGLERGRIQIADVECHGMSHGVDRRNGD